MEPSPKPLPSQTALARLEALLSLNGVCITQTKITKAYNIEVTSPVVLYVLPSTDRKFIKYFLELCGSRVDEDFEVKGSIRLTSEVAIHRLVHNISALIENIGIKKGSEHILPTPNKIFIKPQHKSTEITTLMAKRLSQQPPVKIEH